MPLVRNTETGNSYLEKINTGGDACGRSAIRSYDKQVGSDGVTNSIFTLPWYYVPESFTMFIYVNGQKAEYVTTLDYVAPNPLVQLLQYEETDNQTITFYFGLENDDIVEFMVLGNYSGATNDNLIPDLDNYKTRDATNLFNASQPMNTYKFTGLPIGVDPEDSVNFSQLGDRIAVGGAHYHTKLWNDGMGLAIIDTDDDLYARFQRPIDMNDKLITELATPIATTDATNKAYVDQTLVTDTFLGYTSGNPYGSPSYTYTVYYKKFPGIVGQRMMQIWFFCGIPSRRDYNTVIPDHGQSGILGLQLTAGWAGSTLFHAESVHYKADVISNTEFRIGSFLGNDAQDTICGTYVSISALW